MLAGSRPCGLVNADLACRDGALLREAPALRNLDQIPGIKVKPNAEHVIPLLRISKGISAS